jgi:DNA-binding NarL/FixJ family response regulator
VCAHGRKTAFKPGVTLCGFADRGCDVAELAGASRADVCLLELRLPGDALAALRGQGEGAPAVRIVVWVGSDREPGLLDAVEAGATGCIVGKPHCDAPPAYSPTSWPASRHCRAP